MLQVIKNVLVGITEEGKEEPSSALRYGLSLAQQAGAHVTVHAASLKLAIPHALVSSVAAGLVGSENQRRRAVAGAMVDRIRGEAETVGVACTVESPQLTYSGLRDAFVAQARVHDLCVLDAEGSAVDVDRGLIEAVLFESSPRRPGLPLFRLGHKVTGEPLRPALAPQRPEVGEGPSPRTER